MTHNTPIVPHWFVTDDNRAKAQIKYELNQLESQLSKYLIMYRGLEHCPDEVSTLCDSLSQKYHEYLKLIGDKKGQLDFSVVDTSLNWSAQVALIGSLKEQLLKAVDDNEKKILINRIATSYCQFTKHSFIQTASSAEPIKLLDELNRLFQETDLKLWLNALVNFWNQNNSQYLELSNLFRDWKPEQQQRVLNYFSKSSLVDLINAVFFYKLYPDQLFSEFIHPEKLVSVRMRLGVLHHFIELLQNQLYSAAKQLGLKPGVDYLFHGDELPQGIMIEVNDEYKSMIQSAVKKLKLQFTPEDELQVTLERLHDLGYAYKFWFNPNRLIDAVMVLQQRLVKIKTTKETDRAVFHQEMVILFSQLTTTECLNLYGYFANNDSRYLLYTLFSISHGSILDWLPPLNATEKNAINAVFQALQCVMEALRVALKTRHVTTEPYVYDLGKQQIKAGRRNREAVFRILAIYGREEVTLSETVEKLFSCIEETI